MSEDGMLLNFSLGDEPLAVKPAFRGGRWKDRLTAKKAALHRQKKDLEAKNPLGKEQSLASEGADHVEDIQVRPSKRQRVDKNEQARSPLSAPSSNEQRPTKLQVTRPKQVISSLFSRTATAGAVKAETAQDDETVKPSNAPLADELATFTSLGLSATLANHLLKKLEIKAPTAIQKAAISHLVKADEDAFIQAETGSGKTLAYLLPIVQRIMTLAQNLSAQEMNSRDGEVHRDSGLFAIILAPTRELSKQIAVVLESVLRCAHLIVPGTVIGGEKKKSEKARLRKGLNILVATPGRLADHLENTEVLDVSKVRWLVLDEGDRLMELGFEEEIQKIVAKLDERRKPDSRYPLLPSQRTTVLCSATMKMNVQRLGEISLKNAVHIKGDPSDTQTGQEGEEEGAFQAPSQLKQSYFVVPPKLRLVTLTAVLRRAFARHGSVMKAIVFISCADSVNFHFSLFARVTNNGRPDYPEQSAASPKPESQTTASAASLSSPTNPNINLHKLHGSLPQSIRTDTLRTFHQTKTPSVLLCTDVASRGLDLPNVDLVIEYDPPFSADDHLHRIGRTARAGRDGRATIFLTSGCEEGYVDVLKRSRRDGGKAVVASDVNDILRKAFANDSTAANKLSEKLGSSSFFDTQLLKPYQEAATVYQLEIEQWVLSSPSTLDQARRAFQSHIRAYATHVAAERHIFDIKQLHLGHFAKAFGLRDRPGAINVPGLRGKGPKAGVRVVGGRRKDAGRVGVEDGNEQRTVQTETDEARKKMRKMARMMGGSDEFNIG